MATKKNAPKKQRTRASLFTKLLILALLLGIGAELYRLQGQVRDAKAQQEALAVQVQAQRQTNDALTDDIAAGPTEDKVKDIAREKLGMVEDNELVFYDVSN